MVSMTPLWDKFLATLGFSAAGFSFAEANTALATLVTLSTLAMIIPRALMNWEERAEKRERRRLEREKLHKLEQIVNDGDYDVEL